MISQTNATKLIKIYDYVCEKYEKTLQYEVERFSNNSLPEFTDQEVMTIYLFSVCWEKRFKIKDMYDFTKNYWYDWFPKLPSYAAFCARLNRMSGAFKGLVSELLHTHKPDNMSHWISLTDALPVITCSGKRQAKVAPELTDKTKNPSKGIWYYGMKIHVVGFQVENQMPHPECIILSKASENDLILLKENHAFIQNRAIFADKAYCDKPFAQTMKTKNNTHMITPVKAVKGQPDALKFFDKAADDLYATAVAKVRQPIESLFAWLIEKTDIQRASKVRSTNGLLVHTFGKIAAAFIYLIF